jgi:DNA-binding response OmpR family regulator
MKVEPFRNETDSSRWEALQTIAPRAGLASTAMTRTQTTLPRRARILYVDDEAVFRRLGNLVLLPAGYDVDTAADGVEAWTALQAINYHLLITDTDMPRLTGLELATQARRAGMRLPIVLTSSSSSPMHTPVHAWLDLAAFLSKPFAPNVLIETVAQVLRRANSGRQGSSALTSVSSRLAQSIQPFVHGGINE